MAGLKSSNLQINVIKEYLYKYITAYNKLNACYSPVFIAESFNPVKIPGKTNAFRKDLTSAQYRALLYSILYRFILTHLSRVLYSDKQMGTGCIKNILFQYQSY